MPLGWLVLSVRGGQRVNEDNEGEKGVHSCLGEGCAASRSKLHKYLCACSSVRVHPWLWSGCSPHHVSDDVFHASDSEHHDQGDHADVPRYRWDGRDTLQAGKHTHAHARTQARMLHSTQEITKAVMTQHNAPRSGFPLEFWKPMWTAT